MADLIGKRCWLWHKWGKWGPEYEYHGMVTYLKFGVVISGPHDVLEHRQQRTCEKCGMLEERRVVKNG